MTRLATHALLLPILALGFASSSAAAQYNKYGVHQDSVAPALPDCGGHPTVFCFADSTRHYSDACCALRSTSDWLIVGIAGDSLEIYANADSRYSPSVSLNLPGRKSWQEHLINSAPFVRLRLPETAVYALNVNLDVSGIDSNVTTGLPYELRIESSRNVSARVLAPALNIIGYGKTRVAVRLPGKNPPSSWSKRDAIPAGIYRVFAPDVDSLDICRVPCRHVQRIDLRRSEAITIRP